MFVDKSLSRGLGNRIIGEIRDGADRYLDECRGLLGRRIQKRSALLHLAETLVSAGERASLTQVVGHHPRWRWASISIFFPFVREAPVPSKRSIEYHLLRIFLRAAYRPTIAPERGACVTVQEHALERMFQRMRLTDSAGVQTELHDAMCLSIPLQIVSRRAEMRQIVLPTKSGAFLCSLNDGEDGISAKTWIPRSDDLSGKMRVVESVDRFYDSIGGELGLSNMLAALPEGAPLNALVVPHGVEELVSIHPWLKHEYVPSVDPLDEAWKRHHQTEVVSVEQAVAE